MSTLTDRPATARHEAGRIIILMQSGLEVSFPAEVNPRLSGQSHAMLNNITLSPRGIHWPDLDEDLSIGRILAGDFGQNSGRAA